MDFAGPLPRLRIYTTIGQYARVISDVLAGRAKRGDSILRLEKSIAQRTGTKHAIAMPLGRVGIYLAVKSLISPGQNVIMSPYTIADVVNMVVAAGANPVFADIERATCNISVDEIGRLIDDKTGAVLVTHFYGAACDVERISEICDSRGIPLIEDAAQAFGVRVNGRSVGSFGSAGIFSFGMYKNVNSFFGGALVTNDDELAGRVREEVGVLPYQSTRGLLKKTSEVLQIDIVTAPLLFRSLFFWVFRFAYLNGIDSKNDKMKIDVDPVLKETIPNQYLCRPTPLQARLVLQQLDRVDRDTGSRVEAAKLYHQGLNDLPGLILPPMRTDGSHMYWYYPIQYEKRGDLVRYAMQHRRDISESYHRNCADLPCFERWYTDCPNARETAESVIYLPTYPRYSRDEIEKTIQVIRSYFGR